MLFVSANPRSTQVLGLDMELKGIQQAIPLADRHDMFDVIVVPAARHDDLEQALLERRPTIVHFSGHGFGAGGLAFQGDDEQDAALVGATAIGELFALLKHNVRIVVLNACYSEEQARAIVNAIDFVVGVTDAIGDRAARIFASSFYRGLTFGQSVAIAFGLGVNAVRREGLPHDAAMPTLLVRDGTSSEAKLLKARP